MAPPAGADRAESGDRTLSWLDEDDPNRDADPYVPLVLPPPPPDEPPPPPAVQPRPPGRSRTFLVVMAGLIAIVVAAAVVAAGTAYRLVFDRGPVPTDRTATAPLGNRRDAVFDLVTGTTAVTVRSADLGGDLYRIVTPQGSDILPRPVLREGEVDLHLVPSGEEGPGAVDVLLTSRVTWRLRLTAGAATHVIDMSTGRLTALDLIGGASRAELTLPRPDGTVPIRVTGGVNQLLIHAPARVPTRVRIGSGASTVNLDRLARSQVTPGTVFTPDGWSQGKARYDIDAAAGISTLRLDRLPR
jgi:hypothetical protein